MMIRNLLCKILALLMVVVLCVSIVVPHHHHGSHLCVSNEWVDFVELTIEEHIHECPDCGHTDCECAHHHHGADHDDGLCQLNLKLITKAQDVLTVYRSVVAVFSMPQTVSETISGYFSQITFYSFAEDLPEAVALSGHSLRAPPFVG